MRIPPEKNKAPKNRTIRLSEKEIDRLKNLNKLPPGKLRIKDLTNQIFCTDLFSTIDKLPPSFVDLIIIDPPYNMRKTYNSTSFDEMDILKYEEWIDSWLSKLVRILKPDASVYICADWYSSISVFNTARKYLKIRNRITWEREKGRGAKKNWKNCLEDIWFCTLSENYKFNLDAVKMKRRVLAPYKSEEGSPKDWQSENNKNYRITHPSNIWTDITVPFWSMPENTDHPTQKPEKLIAKLILASSDRGDMVFDPFAGSGTTPVTARKLGRKFCAIERDEYYCCLARKRLELAELNNAIQGYDGNVFWERNSLAEQKKKTN